MFDRYFADQKRGWRRPALMGASVGLHVVVGLAVVGLTWAGVRQKAPAEVPLTFFAPPPPPGAPKATSTAAKPPSSKPSRVSRVNRLVRNTRTVNFRPKEEPADDGPAGAADGVPGGVVGGTGAARIVPQFLFDAQRLASPDPHLPDWFQEQHPHQVVQGLYRICVDTSGHVVDVQAVNGIAGVDAFIIAQLRASWVYRPQPFPVCSPRIIKFKIN